MKYALFTLGVSSLKTAVCKTTPETHLPVTCYINHVTWSVQFFGMFAQRLPFSSGHQSCSIAIGDVTSLCHESRNDPVESTALEGEITTCRVRDHRCLSVGFRGLWKKSKESSISYRVKSTNKVLKMEAAKESRTAHGRSQTEEWGMEGIYDGIGLHECAVVGLQSSQLIQTMVEQLMISKPKPPPPAADVAFLSSAKASKVLSLKYQKHFVGCLCMKKGSQIAKKSKAGHWAPFSFGEALLRK